jgi:putative SbcD/Mre11-related phosphoesterase
LIGGKNFMVTVKFLLNTPASMVVTKNKKILTVSDLHIGLEYELQRLGFKVPSQSNEMARGLLGLLEVVKPNVLVVLGDVKHEIRGLRREIRSEVEKVIKSLSKKVEKIIVVMGNHDGSLKRLKLDGVEVYEASGVSIDGISFAHGNAWPKPELLANDVLMMGHLHPSVSLPCGERRVWVVYYLGKRVRERAKMLLKVDFNIKRLIVHPAYNDYLGCSPLCKSSFQRLSPIFRKLIDPRKGYVYKLDGTFLGRFSLVSSSEKPSL